MLNLSRFINCVAVVCMISLEVPRVTQGHTFADSIGINVKFQQDEPQTDLPLLNQLGVKWVRDSVYWPLMEPVAGKYVPFPDAFRQRLKFYRENNIGVLFGVWYDNPKAYPNTSLQPFHSVDADAYGNYAAEIARQLKQSGVRFALELYNEPHNSLKNMGGTWNGKPPAAWLDQYVHMVSAAVARVKAFDPDVKLFANDDMWIIHYWFLEKGLPDQLDGLTVHPYTKFWPEKSAVDQDTDWLRPFDVVDAGGSFASAVRHLRDHATEKLGHTPAIWASEWGWSLADPVADRPMSEDLMAALIPRAYITSADAGVEVLFWFSIQDNVDGPMGLIDNNRHRRKSYAAFARMSAELGPATQMHHLIGQDHPCSGVQVYQFDFPEGKKLVAWNIDGTSNAEISFAAAVHVRDVFGKEIPLDLNAGNSGRLQLSRSPVYIDGSADSVLTPEVGGGVPAVRLFP